MVGPISESAPVTPPRRGRCCIGCGVFLLVCMLLTVVATWITARWLESSGTIDRVVAEENGPGTSVTSPAGVTQPMSEKWMQYESLAISADGRVAVGVAMPRFSMVTMLKTRPPAAPNPAEAKQKTRAWAQQLLTPRLVIYDLSTNAERELPVDFGTPAALSGAVAVSRDGRRVAVEATEPLESGVRAKTGEETPLGLWVLDRQTGKPTKLADAGQPLEWCPDGSLLAYTLYDAGKERNQVWVAGAGVSPKMVLDMGVEDVHWSADGRTVMVFMAGSEIAGQLPEFNVLHGDAATGAGKTLTVSISRGPHPQALGPDVVAERLTFEGGPGKAKSDTTGQIAAIDLRSGKGFWLSKPFAGSVEVVGPVLGGRYVAVRTGSRLYALSVADGRFRPLLAEGARPEGRSGRMGSTSQVATVRGGRTVLFALGLGPDDITKMMISVFFGNGFGETLWRLDLDEPKLRAMAGSDAPTIPAEKG